MDSKSAREATIRTQFGEIEDGFPSSIYARACEELSPPTTSIDVLELFLNGEPRTNWFPELDHDGLVSHFAMLEEGRETRDGPFLRILFVNVQRTGGGNRIILASPSTLKFLRSHLGVSLVYLDVLGPMQWGAAPGNVCYDRVDSDGTVEAMYHFSTEYSPCHVWYSRRRRTQSTTYILSNCDSKARALILLCASGNDYQSLLRPMVIDAILADSAATKYKVDLQESRDLLLEYEHHGASHLPDEPVHETFQNLHQLSKVWYILSEELSNLDEALTFVLHVHKTYLSSSEYGQHNSSGFHSANHDPPFTNTNDLRPRHETLNYLLTRNNIWKRWVSNYTTRTQIRINLHFNLAAQTDNKINLSIASTSKTIAEATLRDSSSMIVIATMTMLFLPGTFVSAILSMSVFDNSGTDAQGRPTLNVLPQWWIFPVATVILTAAVVGIWRVWQLHRLKWSVSAEQQNLAKSKRGRPRNGGDSAYGDFNGTMEKMRRKSRSLTRDEDQILAGSRTASGKIGAPALQQPLEFRDDDDAGMRPQKKSGLRELFGQKTKLHESPGKTSAN